MIEKVKKNLILINIIIIIFFNNSLNAASNFFIVTKVDNEIITNIDIIHEINYLVSLNNELRNMDKKSLVSLAKNSLIREKIKTNELNKYFKTTLVKKDILEKLIENFYVKLNLKNKDEFKNYLANYDIKITDIEEKIRTEILWNQHIYQKYNYQLNLNIEEFKKKVNDNQYIDNKINKYLLSEILFTLEDKKNFEKKNNEIRNKIKTNGFKTAANIYSISDTAKFGGKIGLIKEKQLSPKILKEIYSINPGEITNTIDVPGGFLILKLEDIITEEFEKNLEVELNNLIKFETDRQLNQFSIIYFNKLKINSKITNE